ncbi:hypothetical protein TPHA_0C00920 [Tetrapisispora phaffii CBS 4417]|uniref:Cleavage and polyadenylation specificity factor subunit 2 n=1 Tax=Tetrapisispora phaffii (strain ATCC 24235 / CBS 4417 / NBRC 1672 / NRRL Y-8282 / UCD 70-5) TaxID=1071381 RepID=G8BR72_TETPH|nr:hypothetical protein TPHA_0C00920 [Tetrapisispora phaffii CBS 4417]CCE62248.1 hypothetical protein TPHA_0C00920 [Tetrapisispora phaffii CBS 4417]
MAYSVTCCDDGSGTTVGTLLKFDNVTILIDPAWYSNSVSYSDSVKYWSTIIPEVDLILLSQPTVRSLGAFALIYYNFYSHFISQIEVYSTLPVSNLGRTSTIELYVARGITGPYDSNEIDLEDIEKAFDMIQTIKYSQLVDLKSKFDGLTFVAHNSGVNVGGSIFCLMTYTEKLIYAPKWNHTRDMILSGASLLDSAGKPISALLGATALITDFSNFASTKSFKRKSKAFKDMLREGLYLNGSIVIPVEISSKFIDLLVQVQNYILDAKSQGQKTEPHILLVSYSRGRILTYAKSMLEWFSSTLTKSWESKDTASPFDLGNLLHVVTPKELKNYPGAKICFVSEVDLLINDVICRLSKLERTSVFLTSTNFEDSSVVSDMYSKWKLEKQNKKVEEGQSIIYSESISIRTSEEKVLKKKDLEAFTKEIETRREKRKDLIVALVNESKKNKGLTDMFRKNSALANTDIVEEGDDDDDDNDDDNDEVVPLHAIKTAVVYPVDTVISKTSLPKNKMFQFQPSRTKTDDYGIMVDYKMFLPEEDITESYNKKRAVESGNGEDDPYDVSESLKSYKRRRNGYSNDNVEPKISIDNIEYLETEKNPSKRKIIVPKVSVKCTFVFLNLESLVDQRSASVIWPSFKIRTMVLFGPPENQNKTLENIFKKKDIDMTLMPLNDVIYFSTTIKSLDISIDPELDELLKWQNIRDGHTVAHFTGRLIKEKAQNVKKLGKVTQDSLRTKLTLKPLENRSRVNTGISLSIGDIRLAEIKRKLTKEKYLAEFKGEGTLVVDNTVAVRKLNDGETIIEGPPSELYDVVKKSITEMLAKI